MSKQFSGCRKVVRKREKIHSAPAARRPELEGIAECAGGVQLECVTDVVFRQDRKRYVRESRFLSFPSRSGESPHITLREIQIKLPGNLHRKNGVIRSRVDQRHKFSGCGKPVPEYYVKVGTRRSIRKRPSVDEKHAGYLTPAVNPSSANGILNRIGSSSPRERAKTVVARMESPVATIRVLSCDRATHAPSGASFKMALRSRGASFTFGFFSDIGWHRQFSGRQPASLA
jgi:hypothetical protein